MTKDTQVLINNTGVINPGNILEEEMSSIEDDMNTNYYDSVNMMKEFFSILDKNNKNRF